AQTVEIPGRVQSHRQRRVQPGLGALFGRRQCHAAGSARRFRAGRKSSSDPPRPAVCGAPGGGTGPFATGYRAMIKAWRAAATAAALALLAFVAGCNGAPETEESAPPVVMAVTAARVRVIPMRQTMRLLGTTVAM